MNMTNPQQPGQQMPQTPMQSSGPNQGQNLLQQPSPPQLQHQMQASPLPVTQSPSSMGAENPGIQPPSSATAHAAAGGKRTPGVHSRRTTEARVHDTNITPEAHPR